MSSSVSISVVAKAAGVSKTTVSRVMNGRLDRFRIGLTTQARVRAVARQLGYQPDPVARDIAFGKNRAPRSVTPQRGSSDGKSQMTEMRAPGQIGVVLSTNSTAATLGLIPGIESLLEAADFRLAVIIVPADPTAARERTARLLNADTAGILCCPTLYPSVSAAMAGKLPVIVLWQGAGMAMMKTVGSEPVSMPVLPSMEGAAAPLSFVEGLSAPGTMEATPDNPATDTAVTEHRPPLMQEAEVPTAIPVVAPPAPVSVPVLPSMEGAALSAPGTMEATPVNPSTDTAVTEHRPPLMPEDEMPTAIPEIEVAVPVITQPEPVVPEISAPVSMPEAEIIAPPPQEPEPSPVFDPGPPIEVPVDTAVTEHRPPLKPEDEMPTAIPEIEVAVPVVVPPEPVVPEISAPAPVPEAEIIAPPPQEPEPSPVFDPGPPIEVPVDTAVTEHRPPLKPEDEMPTAIPEIEVAVPVVVPPEPVVPEISAPAPVPEAEIIAPPSQEPEPSPVSDLAPPIEIPVDTAVTEHRPPLMPEAEVPASMPLIATPDHPASDMATSAN